MSLFSQVWRISAAALVLTLGEPSQILSAPPAPPTFIEESITEFTAAARTEPHTESVLHLDPTKYRAFRFLNPQRIMVGAASEISLTPDGKANIVQAPGTVLTVRANATHRVMSHLALLREGTIDQSLVRKP